MNNLPCHGKKWSASARSMGWWRQDRKTDSQVFFLRAEHDLRHKRVCPMRCQHSRVNLKCCATFAKSRSAAPLAEASLTSARRCMHFEPWKNDWSTNAGREKRKEQALVKPRLVRTPHAPTSVLRASSCVRTAQNASLWWRSFQPRTIPTLLRFATCLSAVDVELPRILVVIPVSSRV